MAVIKQLKTPFGTIRITRGRDGTLAYYQNGCFHSQANANGESICAYVHVIYQLIIQKKLNNILIIGCGGGTLATMLARVKKNVTVVDINPAAFDIAREYFKMPSRVKCITQNGLTYVRETAQHYDAIVIDVFDADNNVPRGFIAPAFLAEVQQKITRGGLLLVNVIAKYSKDRRAYRIAKRVAVISNKTAICQWSDEEFTNAIIIGGALPRQKISFINAPTEICQELGALQIHKFT